MEPGTGASAQPNNPYVPGPGPQSDGGYGGPQIQGFEGMAPAHHQTGICSPPESAFVLNLVLRIASLLLALISVAVIASAEYQILAVDINTGVTVRDRLFKALQVRPYKFLVATGTILMFYELLQIVLSWIQRSRSTPFTSSYTGALVTFIFDHVFAYLMFAAATSGATYSDLFRHDGDGTQCQLVGNLCAHVEAGVAMAFLAFGTLAVLALVSGLNFCKHIAQ